MLVERQEQLREAVALALILALQSLPQAAQPILAVVEEAAVDLPLPEGTLLVSVVLAAPASLSFKFQIHIQPHSLPELRPLSAHLSLAITPIQSQPHQPRVRRLRLIAAWLLIILSSQAVVAERMALAVAAALVVIAPL